MPYTVSLTDTLFNMKNKMLSKEDDIKEAGRVKRKRSAKKTRMSAYKTEDVGKQGGEKSRHTMALRRTRPIPKENKKKRRIGDTTEEEESTGWELLETEDLKPGTCHCSLHFRY